MERKIERSLHFLLIFALSLSLAAVLGCSIYFQRLKQVLLPLLCFYVLIYLVCLRFVRRLTEVIMQPILDISEETESTKVAYPELYPYLERIEGQSREIQRQTQRVQRQKIRLQTVGENMSEGLVVLDRDGTVLSLNESALSIFGISAQEAQNRSFAALCRNEQMTEKLAAVLEGKKDTTECRLGERIYRIFYSPVFERGSVNGAILLMFDTSVQAESERLRREFSANVSHELKTPITTILGYSQIINQGLAKHEDILKFTAKIEKETTRLITLIDDIIKLSHLDEETEQTEQQSIDLLKIAEETAERLEEQAKKRRVRLTVSGEHAEIFGNPGQITELVFNLCDNAIKYNLEDGAVEVFVSPDCLTVRDTGIGIPQEDQSRIFERFYRVDKSRSKSVNGTGLGLSIVKHIARCHHAKIEIESRLGEGTEIRVQFRQMSEE